MPVLQNAEQTDFSATGELMAAERYLKNYNAHIVSVLSAPAPHARSVLEFGAGIGTLAEIWHAKTGVRPECLEIDANQRRVVQSKGFICYRDIADVDATYDLIYTSNVLEHIEDDVQALREIHARLKPGGIISVWVPALQILYSEFDAVVGHYRRYQKAELVEKIQRAGFRIDHVTYADSVGFFASFYLKLRGYKTGLKPDTGRSLYVYDRLLLPIAKVLDWLGARFLFGKNLLAIARKM